ncbi:hypothetical protein EYZ11_000617 [Aspergillus tanneri]|uniref:RNA polymerase II degradation factor 1 n=1 Tax=Aspergillus tanneri TaxID=1220188 RepID=A0A4S3JWP7_9EURO|nr:RNAPII degradation factor [Aspergillus tanneri]KAA8646282.1 RNAPII degradation factor [Aspergillus tanneri]THC99919.1 hypothetical protein EYZ11_000617 [Aspergillus tanneri]
MSEVQSRPAASRGRASGRGGRGGYSSRGGRGGSNRSAKADNSEDASSTFDDEGEIGQMKKKYAGTLPMLNELFPDWTDEDLVFALEDADGDLEAAIDRITEGNVSQWGEVKKKTTDRSRPKPKEVQSTPTETTPVSVRGGRGRGGFEGRGRARGDRGRGGRGGRAGAHTNGSRSEKPAVTTFSTTEMTSTAVTESLKIEKTADSELTAVESIDASKEDTAKTSVIPEGTKKGWASLFAKPTPPPTATTAATPQKKPAASAPAPAPAPIAAPEKPAAAEPAAEQKAPEPAPIPAPVSAPVPVPVEKAPEPVIPKQPELPVAAPRVPEITPAKDDLTRTNLAQIPDVSPPAPTATAASTVGSTLHANSIAVTGTPVRAAPGTYPASALRQSVRGPGAQRRVMEQQEAVVMPGNHAVDRAAVQFGSMGLNGDSADVDIDENREDAETRAQPPQHSPVAPRASLPPSTQPQGSTGSPAVSRPAPGLPPVPQVSAAESSFTDFSRYTDAHKPYDPFSQQVSQPQPQVQEPFANQAPVQPTATTSSEYSPFYAVDHRLPYNYYGSYGQSQDATVAQRAAAGFGVSGAEVQQPHIPTTQPPSRYGHVDAPNSGHTTPNPTLPGATQTPTAAHMPGHAAYGYGYPYFSNPHYATYVSQMNQYGRNRPMYDDARRYDDHYMPHNAQYGYGSQYGPYGKTGMYGQPHGFSYDHSSSPAAAAGTFNQAVPGRDSVYGRTGSAQPSETQQTAAAGANAFGSGMPDVFGRSQAGFGQSQPISQQPPVTTEEPKSFDTPKAGGPSPSLAQANRPGSATSNVPGQSQAQTGLPPLQGQQGQQGFGGYPHLNPQYGGGLGGLSGHQAAASQSHQQATGYGNYGGAGFANYYGNSGRGGWGGNYGH